MNEETTIPAEVREYMRERGRAGGSVKSDAKRASGKINAAKATAARMKAFEERKAVQTHETKTTHIGGGSGIRSDGRTRIRR